MKKLKQYKYHYLAFLLPLLVITLIFLMKGVFTNKTLLTSDLREQYLSLISYLNNLLHHEVTFPYTLEKGLGGSMYGAFFYALANPLNLLVYFFSNIELFVTLLIIFKIALAGLTMFIYLHHQNKYPDAWCLTFSFVYALMGYTIVYATNFMWLDAVIFLPLVILGIENIIDNKRDILYILTLFLSLVFNYYTGYMVALFSVLYFFYYLYLKNTHKRYFQDNLKVIGHFLLITILTGLMVSFVLVPIFYESLNFSRVNGSFKIINYNFLDLIAGNYIGFGSIDNPVNYYGFLTYAGTITILLIINYLTNKKIPTKERIAAMMIYLILMVPVIFPPLNALWHLFTFPQGFNYRYSFIFVFFSLTLAMKSLVNLNTNGKHLLYTYIIFVIMSCSLIYVCYKTPDYYLYLTPLKVFITMLLVFIGIILIRHHNYHLILGFLVFEIILNASIICYESSFLNKSEYLKATQSTQKLTQICTLNTRCETMLPFTQNEPLLHNYNGISVFLSSLNEKSINFMRKAHNLDSNANYYAYEYADIIMEMLLGVQYVSLDDAVYGYEHIDTYDVINSRKAYILKNPYALSLAYMVSSDIKDFHSSSLGINYLNELLKAIASSEDDYLLKLDVHKIDDKHYEILKNKQYPYIYIFTDNHIDNTLTSSNVKIKDTPTYNIVYDKNAGNVLLTFTKKTSKVRAYTIDLDKLSTFVKDREELIIDDNGGNYLKGHITNKEDGILLTTIPYEKGWMVYVDGVLVKHYEVLDNFIAIDLTKGEHTIILKYNVPGMETGVFVSLFSLAFLLGYELHRKKYI